jgi:hypothetical protein
MSQSVAFRAAAALALVAGLFLALPGCGGGKPQADKGGDKDKDKDKKGEPNTNTGDPKGDPKGTPKVDPPRKPETVDPVSGVGKDAIEFLQAVKDGTAKADKLSAAFVKLIGLPAELPSDKAKGYSADAAEGWLKRVGNGVGFGPPLYSKQTGDTAVLRGGLVGKPGGYSLRMVKEGGAWKADWLSLSSVEVKPVAPAANADAIFQEFAAAAVAEAVCDKDAMPRDERTMVIAAGLTPAYRTKLAPPFDSDKAQGFDYNRGALALEAGKLGDKAESGTLTPQGDAAFKVEVTRAGGAKSAYLVKLAKGTTPGQWLVENVTPQ